MASVFGRVAGPYAQWLVDIGRVDEARGILHRCVASLRSAYATFLTIEDWGRVGRVQSVQRRRPQYLRHVRCGRFGLAKALLGRVERFYQALVAAGVGLKYRGPVGVTLPGLDIR